MSRTVKRSLAVTALFAAATLGSGLVQAQPYGAHPEWGGMPPMQDEFGPGGPGGPGA